MDEPVGLEIGDNAYLLATSDSDDFITMTKVLKERARQRSLGYSADHDDKHELDAFAFLIMRRLNPIRLARSNPAALLESVLVQIAAIAIAAASSTRRRTQLRLPL